MSSVIALSLCALVHTSAAPPPPTTSDPVDGSAVVGEDDATRACTRLPLILAATGVFAQPTGAVVGIAGALGAAAAMEALGVVPLPATVILVGIAAVATGLALPAAIMGTVAYFVSLDTMGADAARRRAIGAALGNVLGSVAGVAFGGAVLGLGYLMFLPSKGGGSGMGDGAGVLVMLAAMGAGGLGWYVGGIAGGAGTASYVDGKWPVE